MVKVQCTVMYNDLQLNRLINLNEVIEVTNERASYLVDRGLVKVIEVIPEEVKEETTKVKPKKTKKK